MSASTSKQNGLALVSGALFGAGLVVSGMTQPSKVMGFLDPFGAWDLSLMFVMMGAIAVHFVAYRLAKGRRSPLFAEKWSIPSRRDIDLRLVAGAAIFGAGWGLGGYCPGPGVVSLSTGGTGVVVFVGAMLAGMLLTARVESALAAKRTQPEASEPRVSEPSAAR